MSGDDAESDVDGDLTTENGSESRNKAAIWLHFVQLPNSQSKCNYCQTILKNLYGNTTCLQRHMCSKHPAEYKKYKIQDAKNKTERAASKRKSSSSTNPGNTCSSAKQTKISDCFKVKQPLPASHPVAKQMTRAIGEWIAINLQPYSVVEERGFVKVMKLAMPEYNIPSRTTFSRSVIPELFKEQTEKVKTKLEEMKSQATSLALTTDLWSSRANDSYISLTGHFMSPSFEIISICMGNSIFPGSHTSEAILNKLMAMVNVWNLGDVTETLPVYVVTDNARNLKVAINRSLWTPMQCFAHTLQLVIHDAKKEDAIPDVIRKARTIVSHYNQSPKAESNLHEQQSRHKLPQQNLPQDVPTRWNSEFYMLHRLVGNKAAIISEYNDSDDTGRMDMLTRADWKLAEGIVKILKPFADATEEISGEKYPTLSLVIPIIFQLEKSLLRFIGNADQGSGIGFARVMLRNLKARFPLYMDDYERCTAMVLDPRFKNILLNEVRKNSVQRWLLAEMLQVNGDLHAHATPEDVAGAELETEGFRATVVVVIGKLCLTSEDVAKLAMPFLQELLQRPCPSAMKVNIICIMSDMCIKCTSLVEPVLSDICLALRDPDIVVREKTLVALVQLLQEDYLKIRTDLFYHILSMLCDTHPSVQNMASYYVTECLLTKHPNFTYQHFIQALFYYNNYQGHEKYSQIKQKQQDFDQYSLSKEERRLVYRFMLDNMNDVQRFEITHNLCTEILNGVIEGTVSLEGAGHPLLQDTFYALSSDEIRQSTLRSRGDDEPPVNEAEMAAIILVSTRKTIVSQVMKKAVIENIVPIITQLKHLLETQKSALILDLMVYLRDLMRDYKNEIKEIFAQDKQLAAEILYDLKVLEDREKAEKKRKLKEVQTRLSDSSETEFESTSTTPVASPGRPVVPPEVRPALSGLTPQVRRNVEPFLAQACEAVKFIARVSGSSGSLNQDASGNKQSSSKATDPPPGTGKRLQQSAAFEDPPDSGQFRHSDGSPVQLGRPQVVLERLFDKDPADTVATSTPVQIQRPDFNLQENISCIKAAKKTWLVKDTTFQGNADTG